MGSSQAKLQWPVNYELGQFMLCPDRINNCGLKICSSFCKALQVGAKCSLCFGKAILKALGIVGSGVVGLGCFHARGWIHAMISLKTCHALGMNGWCSCFNACFEHIYEH